MKVLIPTPLVHLVGSSFLCHVGSLPIHSPRFSLFTLIRSSFPFIPRSGAPAGRNDKGKR